jgi:ATP-dependent Clp protease adaptor protein ClpS
VIGRSNLDERSPARGDASGLFRASFIEAVQSDMLRFSERLQGATFTDVVAQDGRAMSDSDRRGGGGGDRTNTGVVVKARPKTRKPAMYKVLMLNDDYTPMEFVVHVLERFFQKSREEATRIMLHVHRRGVGVCGVYTYEVAETKVTQVMDLARQNQHPLQCTIEKE